MSLHHNKLDLYELEELDDLGLLDEAIATATARRNSSLEQSDAISELDPKEANAVIGGIRPGGSTCGMMPCEPL
ncbi:hypothetical protein [Altericista sp. CCNU0014]|uniref:hypothetical protein n=1 Tax=Altericista sp. CCNU0014 TaxID=3082949 RepID=UPI00384C7BAE